MAQNTFYLTEALYISDAPIDRPLLQPLPSGGGGFGSGGWGLSEGRPRGTGGPGRFNSHEPAVRRVLDDERRGTDAYAQQTYQPLIAQLPAVQQAERAALRQRAASSGGTPFAQLTTEQAALTALINDKRQSYLALLPTAHSFYGAMPFYKRTDSLVTRIYDPGAFNDATTLFDILFASVDAAYRAHLESESIRLFSNDLAALAAQLDEAELQTVPVDLQQAAARREAQIREEKRICFECLPAYLQHELISLTPNQDNVTLAQALHAYRESANQLANLKRQQVPGYSASNPEINGPLSKPQLEALHHLVDEQTKRRAGPLWAEYHQALVLNESIRYLELFAFAMTGLQERAEQVDTLLARHMAEQEAARLAIEAERRARESERLRISYAGLGSAATAAPLLIPLGGAAFDLTAGTYTALQHAIRIAVVAMAARVAPLAPLVVGIVAMSWSPSLGNGERQFAASVPLADLSPPDNLDLTTIAAAGGTLTLPYALASREEDDRLHLLVSQDSGPIPVRAAVFDNESQVYSLALDTPSRILTWTPLNAPGSELGSSTSLPVAPTGAIIYTGSELIPQTDLVESYPDLDPLELDRIIVTFPVDSGLAPILVMFRDRRFEPGAATGSGQDITGVWLGDSTRNSGAPIPSQIAEKLAGQEFKSFNKLRQAMWTLVAQDAILAQQFSPQNIARMTRGLAPKVTKSERHQSLDTFIIHHVIPIAAGGAVYDIENLRIVTPLTHQHIHYGRKP